MLETLKPLLESGLVNEEHDKGVMIKTLDKMVAETLNTEIKSIKEERNQVAKLKVQTVKEMRNAAKKFNTFATRALSEELAQFASERKLTESHKQKLEKFVMSTLAEEINEFAEDKKDLAENKVKLISEAKGQLDALKQKFVNRSSKAVSRIVAETLNHEITQLHEDIKIARQNNFGRKIYEAFATEFSGTYLNENKVVKDIKNKLEETTKKLTETSKLVESKNKELNRVQGRVERDKVLNELLSPLDRSKQDVMKQLLESVQTPRLRFAYDRYLPGVLSNKTQQTTAKSVLHESTGNKQTKETINDPDALSDIKRLAGLK